jgi:hypothetical protein
MNDKKKDRDTIIKELLDEYEPQFLDKATIKAIKKEWEIELKGYTYIKDPIELKKSYYIRYIDLKFTKLSDPCKIENIEYGVNGSVLFVESKTGKIKPPNFFIFQTKHDKLTDRAVNDFIKKVYKDAGLEM